MSKVILNTTQVWAAYVNEQRWKSTLEKKISCSIFYSINQCFKKWIEIEKSDMSRGSNLIPHKALSVVEKKFWKALERDSKNWIFINFSCLKSESRCELPTDFWNKTF